MATKNQQATGVYSPKRAAIVEKKAVEALNSGREKKECILMKSQQYTVTAGRPHESRSPTELLSLPDE